MEGKRRGGYAMNLTHQVRLRISEEMFNSFVDISNKTHTTVSKIMRELLRVAMKGIVGESS